jgi:hypothetical protein
MVEGLEQLRLTRETEGVRGVVGSKKFQDDIVARAPVHCEICVSLCAGPGQSDQLVAAIDPLRGRAVVRVCRANCRERAPQLGRSLRPVLWLERQRGRQHELEVVRRVATGMSLAQRLKRLLGQLAGQQVVQRCAEPEHVEPGVRRDEAGLERQISRGTQRLAHGGRMPRHGPCGDPVARGAANDSKVDQLHLQGIGVGEHDVRRLHVPVDQTLAVGDVQGVRDLDPDLEGLPPRHRPGLSEVLAEVRALDQLKNGVKLLAVAVVGQDPHDRGMVQARQDLRLLGEAALEVRVTRAQQLDRDEPVELPVARPHDHSPAADADAVQEFETTPETPVGPFALLVPHFHERPPSSTGLSLKGEGHGSTSPNLRCVVVRGVVREEIGRVCQTLVASYSRTTTARQLFAAMVTPTWQPASSATRTASRRPATPSARAAVSGGVTVVLALWPPCTCSRAAAACSFPKP